MALFQSGFPTGISSTRITPRFPSNCKDATRGTPWCVSLDQHGLLGAVSIHASVREATAAEEIVGTLMMGFNSRLRGILSGGVQLYSHPPQLLERPGQL